MVNRYLPLDRMLRLGFGQPELSDFSNYRVILDTNAFRYGFNFERFNGKAYVTKGVVGELEKYSSIFGRNPLDRLRFPVGVMSGDVIYRHEPIIDRASFEIQRTRNKNKGLIGNVDAGQVSLAMKKVESGNKVALMTDDADIHRTIRVLTRKLPELRGEAVCISARDYFTWNYPHLLRNIDENERRVELGKLEKLYGHAAA